MGEFASAAKPEVEIVLENNEEVAVPMPQPGGCCRCNCTQQTCHWIFAGFIAFIFLGIFAQASFAVADAEVGVEKIIIFSVVGGTLFVLVPGFLIVCFTTRINNSITKEMGEEAQHKKAVHLLAEDRAAAAKLRAEGHTAEADEKDAMSDELEAALHWLAENQRKKKQEEPRKVKAAGLAGLKSAVENHSALKWDESMEALAGSEGTVETEHDSEGLELTQVRFPAPGCCCCDMYTIAWLPTSTLQDL